MINFIVAVIGGLLILVVTQAFSKATENIKDMVIEPAMFKLKDILTNIFKKK